MSSGERVKALATTVQIPRKHYAVIKAIFDDHDGDSDGFITQEEFIEAVSRADQTRANDEKERVKKRYFDSGIGDTVAALAEHRYLHGAHAQRQHASAMFLTMVAKKPEEEMHQISLEEFVHMYFPHLSRAAVKKACDKYQKKPPPQKRKTLADVKGALEEVQAVFAGLDSDNDGLVRVRSLEPLMMKLGISERDVEDWLKELPPVLLRATGELKEGASISRMKSTLNIQDMERLLEPVLLPASPKKLSKKEIDRKIEYQKELALDVMYGH